MLLGLGGAPVRLKLEVLLSITNLIARYMPFYDYHPLQSAPTQTACSQFAATVARISVRLQMLFGELGDLDNRSSPKLEVLQSKAIADLFINEIVEYMRLIRTAPVLVTYLYYCTMTGALPSSRRAALRLEVLLYAFSTPGGPYYPNRSVRVAARAALDILRPQGKLARFLVRSCFRCLRPLHAFASVAHTGKQLAYVAVQPVQWAASGLVSCCVRKRTPSLQTQHAD